MSGSDKKSQFIEYTKCPKCGTLFDVSDINFSDSKGWVQCGDCTEQFDAAKNSVNYSALLEQSILANMDGMNSTPSNFTVGGLNVDSTREFNMPTQSEEIDLLDGALSVAQTDVTLDVTVDAVLDVTADDEDFVISQNDFITESNNKADRSIEVVAQETSYDSEDYTLTKSRFIKNDPSIERNVIQEKTVQLNRSVNEHDIDIEPDLYRELSGESRSSLGTILLYFLAIPLILVLGLVLLLQLQNRNLINVIPQNVVTQIENKVPFLANSMGQSDSPDLSKIHLAATRMERHSSKKDYVNIILQLTNKNKIEQPYPALEVSFTDAVGKTVARRVFAPADFLAPNSPEVLQPLESKPLTLTFVKLPEGSVGYEIHVTKP